MKKHVTKKLILMSALLAAFASGHALASDYDEGKKGGMFAKHDTNGDGVISKEEFLSHAEERFSKMDTDGSGDVTKEEAKAGHEKMREKMKERREHYKDKSESEE